jgi:hypothetical protein
MNSHESAVSRSLFAPFGLLAGFVLLASTIPTKTFAQRAVTSTESMFFAAATQSRGGLPADSVKAKPEATGFQEWFRRQTPTRSGKVALYFVAGGVLGAVAGYAVYCNSTVTCDDYDYICGAFTYTVTGASIGMAVGALVGYVRTRPKKASTAVQLH